MMPGQFISTCLVLFMSKSVVILTVLLLSVVLFFGGKKKLTNIMEFLIIFVYCGEYVYIYIILLYISIYLTFEFF